MKNMILIILFLLVGCAFVKSQKESFDLCMADPECKAYAESWQDRTETASTIVASGIPVPGAAAAPKIIGYIALGLAAIIGGRALKKKEQSNVNP